MYEVRCTMYDLGSSRACARILRSRSERDMMESCAGVVRKGRGGETPPMYEVRCTMYDCGIRARCAGRQSRNERNVIKPCTDVVTKRREGGGRQGLLMYDFRCTMYDLGSSRACARILRSRGERDMMESCAGVVRKGRGGENAAYVRCTMYDVRFGKCAWSEGQCVRVRRLYSSIASCLAIDASSRV